LVSGLPDWHGSINIAKQTLANVDMNINAQALNYVRIKSLYGSPHVIRTSKTLGTGETWTVLDISGEGYLMYVMIENEASGDAKMLNIELRVDNEIVCYYKVGEFEFYGFGATSYPFRLYKCTDTVCMSQIILPYPLPYGQSLKLVIYNASGTYSQTVWIDGFYTIT